MPLVLAIFEVLARPAEDNDQAAALEKQMLRRSYFTFIQTITGSGMNEVMANQGELETHKVIFVAVCGGFYHLLLVCSRGSLSHIQPLKHLFDVLSLRKLKAKFKALTCSHIYQHI